MKISLIEPLGVDAQLIEELSAPFLSQGHTFQYYPTKTADPDELAARTADSDIVMLANTPYPALSMEASPNLKMLSVAFTGIDHIDLDYCRQHEIMVCNSANYSNQSVAELVIGLTLGLYRSISACDSAVRNSRTGALLMGTELSGKVVGIIGTGKIGLRTAALFQAFGAKILGCSRSVSEAAVNMGIEYCGLDELLSRSDIVSLHVPNTPSTFHLLDREHLSMMKPDAILINCARGPIVDNQALADLLTEGKIAGAGIDVFDMEPPIPQDYPLLHAPNTLLTPHIAYATAESMIKRAHIVFDNVACCLNGQPQNVCRLD